MKLTQLSTHFQSADRQHFWVLTRSTDIIISITNCREEHKGNSQEDQDGLARLLKQSLLRVHISEF